MATRAGKRLIGSMSRDASFSSMTEPIQEREFTGPAILPKIEYNLDERQLFFY
jgi:hypothetical protein